jgi:hypothetical protein
MWEKEKSENRRKYLKTKKQGKGKDDKGNKE